MHGQLNLAHVTKSNKYSKQNYFYSRN